MQKTLDLVISYINSGLNKSKNNIQIENDKLFYIIIKENGLSGIVYYAINEEKVTKELYQSLLSDFFAYVQSDNLQTQLINQLKNLFDTNQIEYVFLKGSHLKTLYPESHMRAMGDIDVLIKSEDLKKVHQILNNNNLKLVSRSPAHDVFKTKGNLMVEIHPGFTDLKNPNYESFLNKAWNYVNNNELNPTYELMYLTYHLAKHFYSGGIGLRSVLDIGIFLKANEFNFDEKLLIAFANETNSFKFLKTIIFINEKLFKIKNNFKFMEAFTLDEAIYNETIRYITKSGIHGWGSDFNAFSARVVKEEQGKKKKGKLRLILSRAFPKYKEMKEIYPILKKLPFLLPIFWIIRLFKLVFLRGRTNYQKIKDINKVDNTETVKKIFNNIGL